MTCKLLVVALVLAASATSQARPRWSDAPQPVPDRSWGLATVARGGPQVVSAGALGEANEGASDIGSAWPGKGPEGEGRRGGAHDHPWSPSGPWGQWGDSSATPATQANTDDQIGSPSSQRNRNTWFSRGGDDGVVDHRSRNGGGPASLGSYAHGLFGVRTTTSSNRPDINVQPRRSPPINRDSQYGSSWRDEEAVDRSFGSENRHGGVHPSNRNTDVSRPIGGGVDRNPNWHVVGDDRESGISSTANRNIINLSGSNRYGWSAGRQEPSSSMMSRMDPAGREARSHQSAAVRPTPADQALTTPVRPAQGTTKHGRQDNLADDSAHTNGHDHVVERHRGLYSN